MSKRRTTSVSSVAKGASAEADTLLVTMKRLGFKEIKPKEPGVRTFSYVFPKKRKRKGKRA